VIRRSLTDVSDPAQRLAVASFPVRLASHPCACGKPDIRRFPRAGAFLFVWEYTRPAGMGGVSRRPAAFHVAQRVRRPYDCARPSWMTLLRDAGRVFQVEVYLGPAATPASRARMDALLDSLHAVRSVRQLG
jgi:hypothetical protein